MKTLRLILGVVAGLVIAILAVSILASIEARSINLSIAISAAISLISALCAYLIPVRAHRSTAFFCIAAAMLVLALVCAKAATNLTGALAMQSDPALSSEVINWNAVGNQQTYYRIFAYLTGAYTLIFSGIGAFLSFVRTEPS